MHGPQETTTSLGAIRPFSLDVWLFIRLNQECFWQFAGLVTLEGSFWVSSRPYRASFLGLWEENQSAWKNTHCTKRPFGLTWEPFVYSPSLGFAGVSLLPCPVHLCFYLYLSWSVCFQLRQFTGRRCLQAQGWSKGWLTLVVLMGLWLPAVAYWAVWLAAIPSATARLIWSLHASKEDSTLKIFLHFYIPGVRNDRRIKGVIFWWNAPSFPRLNHSASNLGNNGLLSTHCWEVT